jgi:hypothetical protein
MDNEEKDEIPYFTSVPSWVFDLRRQCEEFLAKSPNVRGDPIDLRVSYAWAMRILHDSGLTVRPLDIVLAREYLASCVYREMVDTYGRLPDPTSASNVLVFLAELDGWLQKVEELHTGLRGVGK